MYSASYILSTLDVFLATLSLQSCVMGHIHRISTNGANYTSCVVACASLTLCNCDLKPFFNTLFLYHKQIYSCTGLWALSNVSWVRSSTRAEQIQTLTENNSCCYWAADVLLLLHGWFRQGDGTKYQLSSGSTQYFLSNQVHKYTQYKRYT